MLYEAKQGSKAYEYIKSILDAEFDYLIGDFPACFGDTPLAIPKVNIPSDKQCQTKEQNEFTIKGIKIMASSKKDAIKKYNHRKK